MDAEETARDDDVAEPEATTPASVREREDEPSAADEAEAAIDDDDDDDDRARASSPLADVEMDDAGPSGDGPEDDDEPQEEEDLDDIDGDTASESSEDDEADRAEDAMEEDEGEDDDEELEDDAEDIADAPPEPTGRANVEEDPKVETPSATTISDAANEDVDAEDILAEISLAGRQELDACAKSLLASGSKDVSDDVAAAFATKHDLKPHEIKVAVSHLYDAHAEKIAVAAAAAASASPVSAAAPIVLDASPAKPAAAKKNPAATAHGGLPGKPLAAASSPSAKPATATVTFATKTGISAEVRVDLVCGPARGTLVLPKGYKQKQEYVVYPDGRKISPAAFERDGGKEKSKSWKNSCIVVTSDAFNGKTFKRWVDATGYHPVGTEIEGAAAPADEKKKKSKKSSKEKSKKAEEEDEEEVEKSVFERNLEPLLDDAGGIKAIDMTGRFVWLMRNALKNAERSLVISVIHRTSKPIMRSFVDGSDGVKVLYEWCAAARDTNKSSLVLKILKTLRKLPVTFAVLEKTPEFAKFVNKLRKYAPPGKESEDLTIQVQDNAMELKAKWVKMITAENAAKEAAAAKKAAAAKAAAAPPVVGVKRDAAAAAAAAATAAAAKRPRVDAVPTPPQPAVAKPTLNPKPAAPAPTKIAAPAPSSTKIGSVATTTKVTTTKVTTTKVTTTISRPASSALSFGGINIRGAGFPSKPSGGDASKATSAKPAKPASPPPPKFKYSKPTSARAKKGLSWAADTALEAVQFFFKDDAAAKPPSPPSISRADADGGKDKDDDENETEDDAEAMKKARQRQERELAAEARAANLTRQRRLNEMRAIGSWRRPVTYVYPKDVEIESGSESTEAKRMAQRVSRVPETTYAMASLIPASPGEAPGEAPHDDAKTPAVPVVAAKQQPQQQQQQQQQQGSSMHQNQYASAQQQQQHQQQGGQGGGFDANALQALLASVQSGALKGGGGGGGGGGGASNGVAPLPPPPSGGNGGGYGGNPPMPRGRPPAAHHQQHQQQRDQGQGQGQGQGQKGQGQGGGFNDGWTPQQPGGICAFFNTPKGCRHGDACKFSHIPGAPTPAPGNFPPKNPSSRYGAFR